MATTSGKPLVVLVLEDDSLDFEILENTLVQAGLRPDCRRVDREADFVAQLTPEVDVILSDYTLPGWNAVRALELYRASRLEIPFIVVSGTISEEVAVECMRQGASDYLLKDRLGRLGPAIMRAIDEFAERRLVESLSTRLLRAQEEERKNIARELHDQVGQGLAVLLIELHNLATDFPHNDPARKSIQNITRLVRDHEATVRDLGLLLRPYMLDDLGLIPALNWDAREIFRRHGVRVTVDADDSCNLLTDDYRTCIYRVVQETLRNVTRHARAATAHVSVRLEPSQIRVEVEDDGCGFDTRYSKGMGLLGIEERARHLGGVCQFHSTPGRGTRISVLLPLAGRSAAHREEWTGAAARSAGKAVGVRG
jgi:signal transduction histidine kinase